MRWLVPLLFLSSTVSTLKVSAEEDSKAKFKSLGKVPSALSVRVAEQAQPEDCAGLLDRLEVRKRDRKRDIRRDKRRDRKRDGRRDGKRKSDRGNMSLNLSFSMLFWHESRLSIT